MKTGLTISQLIDRMEVEEKTLKEGKYKLELLADLKRVAKLYEGEGRVISTKEIVERMKNRPQELIYPSTFQGLDAILGGFRPNQLITIAAPTKSGKTSFCVDLTVRLKDLHPLWFFFEETPEEIVEKFLERNEPPPYFYTPETMIGNTLAWIEQKIVESIAKYDSKIVFIDHLHFIVPFSEERSDLRIGETMRALKGLAKKWGVIIFIVAHLKKTKLDIQPDLEDLRDSSFIAQESDTVILFWRETKRENKRVVITNNVNLSVQANRRTGKTGNVSLIFDNGKFIEKEWNVDLSESKKADEDFDALTAHAVNAIKP